MLAAFLMPWGFAQVDAVLRITEGDLQSYTPVAREALLERQEIISSLQGSGIPILVIVMFFSGLALLLQGASQWRDRQLVANETENVVLEKQRAEILNAPSEKMEEKRAREAEEFMELAGKPDRVPEKLAGEIGDKRAPGDATMRPPGSLVEDANGKTLGDTNGKPELGARELRHQQVRQKVVELEGWLYRILVEAYGGDFNVTPGAAVRNVESGRTVIVDAIISPVRDDSYGQVAFDVRLSRVKMFSKRMRDSMVRLASVAVWLKGGFSYPASPDGQKRAECKAIQVVALQDYSDMSDRDVRGLELMAGDLRESFREPVGILVVDSDRLGSIGVEDFRDAVLRIWTGEGFVQFVQPLA
ncbi:hypothetical protein [Brachybacterium aquaticum]|uniref:Uncharacterized protein n=1 Tax=Brachybacterium aquaticum TaxID=1432564 RepID=A0A841AHG4_9MICO|nr:hypothetical protein [Brachybacterium aquaticum]MBB5832514.1 hypothetical protein [Brachybacterium aquaticum]